MSEEKNRQPTYFAVFLKKGEHISADGINRIAERNRISPIFFAISRDVSADVSRAYARILDTVVAFPKSYGEFSRVIEGCAFSICENLSGAFLSLLCRRPIYINSDCDGCRSFMEEASRLKLPPGIILDFNKNKLSEINTPKVRDEDFEYAAKKIRAYVSANFNVLFER